MNSAMPEGGTGSSEATGTIGPGVLEGGAGRVSSVHEEIVEALSGASQCPFFPLPLEFPFALRLRGVPHAPVESVVATQAP